MCRGIADVEPAIAVNICHAQALRYLSNMPQWTDRGKDSLWAAVYFLASAIITWLFIVAGKSLYTDVHKMLLSCAIAHDSNILWTSVYRLLPATINSHVMIALARKYTAAQSESFPRSVH